MHYNKGKPMPTNLSIIKFTWAEREKLRCSKSRLGLLPKLLNKCAMLNFQIASSNCPSCFAFVLYIKFFVLLFSPFYSYFIHQRLKSYRLPSFYNILTLFLIANSVLRILKFEWDDDDDMNFLTLQTIHRIWINWKYVQWL